MEDLQWARILVKSNGDDLPCSLEIGVEEETYNLSLWWEVLLSLRQDSGMKRGSMSRPSGEVRGVWLHASDRVWKSWRARETRCSSSQWMGLEGRRREWASMRLDPVLKWDR